MGNKRKQTARSKKDRLPSREVIRTGAALAALVARDRATISRWLIDDRWVFGKPPWPLENLPQIKRWMEENIERDKNAPSSEELEAMRRLRQEKMQAEVNRLKYQEETARLELEEMKAKVIDFARLHQFFLEMQAGDAKALDVVIRSGVSAAQLQPLFESREHAWERWKQEFAREIQKLVPVLPSASEVPQ